MTKKNKLTSYQKEVLEILSAYIKANGYPPTLREILERSTLKSIRGVVLQLDALDKFGFIDRHSRARAISLNTFNNLNKVVKVPLMTTCVSAGLMNWVESNESKCFNRFLKINFTSCKGYQDLYAVKVKGDSMIDADIYEDDYLLFVCQNTAKDGDIVLASHDDEMTVKKFRIVEERPMLFPANKKYSPILGEFSIQGKVINVVRSKDAHIATAESS